MTANQEQMMMAAMQQGMQGQMQGPPEQGMMPPQSGPPPQGGPLESNDIVGDESPEAQEGRGGDTILAHLTPGEVIIPMDMLNSKKDLLMIQKLFDRHEVSMNMYTAGDEENNINPETGYPEFDMWSRAAKPFKKAARQVGGVFKKAGSQVGGAVGKAGEQVGHVVGKAASQTYHSVGKAAEDVGHFVQGAYDSFSGKTLERAKKAAKEEADRAIENMRLQIVEYEKNLDAQVKKAREEGAAVLKTEQAKGNASKNLFQENVKDRMRAEESYQAGSDSGASAGSGKGKSFAQHTARKRRAKQAIKSTGGRPL